MHHTQWAIRTSPFLPRSGPGKSTSFQGLHAGCTHKRPAEATEAAASGKPGGVNKPQLRHSYCRLIWSSTKAVARVEALRVQ